MHLCPHCHLEVSPQESVCPHCAKEMAPLFSTVPPPTHSHSKNWTEFVAGFLIAFIVSCAIPILWIGAILSAIIGVYFLGARPNLGKGLLLGAFAGFFGAYAVCMYQGNRIIIF